MPAKRNWHLSLPIVFGPCFSAAQILSDWPQGEWMKERLIDKIQLHKKYQYESYISLSKRNIPLCDVHPTTHSIVHPTMISVKWISQCNKEKGSNEQLGGQKRFFLQLEVTFWNCFFFFASFLYQFAPRPWWHWQCNWGNQVIPMSGWSCRILSELNTSLSSDQVNSNETGVWTLSLFYLPWLDSSSSSTPSNEMIREWYGVQLNLFPSWPWYLVYS